MSKSNFDTFRECSKMEIRFFDTNLYNFHNSQAISMVFFWTSSYMTYPKFFLL